LQDLRSKLRVDLEASAKDEADNRLRSELIQKLIEKHDFEVPDTLVDIQARNLLNNFAQDMAQRGMDLNNVEKDFVQMVYTQMQAQAERDVRGAMLLERVAELENVEISPEEINEEIEKMARHYRTTPEEIRQSLNQQQGGEANIANSLRTRKAVEALATNAKITDGEWIDPNQPPAVAEENETEAGEAETIAGESSEDEEESKEKKPKAEKKKAETKEPKKKAAKKD
jgi:trigger factor